MPRFAQQVSWDSRLLTEGQFRTCFSVRARAELEARKPQNVSELMKLENANEGAAAFLERRTPQWRSA